MSLEQKKHFLKTELIPPGILTYTIEGKKKQSNDEADCVASRRPLSMAAVDE
jgi:hypothetical protein